MFATSTQREHWMFTGETEINSLRAEVNSKFICKHSKGLTDPERAEKFLSIKEERQLCRHYEYVLKELCTHFQPPMPKYVMGTALVYFKRHYIHNSVMDYHPRDIMLTSIYLACKVEEFNVSIGQFVGNLKGDREKYSDIVLGLELLMMQSLQYHLTVHNPYRPQEGLLIDLKTRCKLIEDQGKLRKGAEDFIDKSLGTDACLIAAPSQIALAAILNSASKDGVSLDGYVADTLLSGATQETLMNTVHQVKKVRYLVKNIESLDREVVKQIEKKLKKCRNQENNPESEIYKRKMEELFEEDEELRSQKRHKTELADEKANKDLLGI